MSTIPVLMVFHNHQPVGNFPWVMEDCFRTAYSPFLEVLEQHPRIRVGLHFTGPLLEWLQCAQPHYLARVRALVAQGRVEVLGGGFYEPILPVIPECDRLGQLAMMQQFVQETFGKTATGAWLAERVWDPALPAAFAKTGIHYTLIDDEVFHRNGFSEAQTRCAYLTEYAGLPLRLLPISHTLRYTLPTKPIPEVLATFRDMVLQGAEVLIYAEDGERYGNWPGTFHYLYGEEAYLDNLFGAIEAADDEFTTMLPGTFARDCTPRALSYLPPASYNEMMQWSAGYWPNFLTRYSESNLMHKKMYQVSHLLASVEAAGCAVQEAKQHLYAGQCNCAYWYGVFGGIYLPHLRRAIYAHLLTAERLLRAEISTPPAVVEIVDFDFDGHDEILLRAGELTVGIAPAQGGGVFSLEHLALASNLLMTLKRYPAPAELPTDYPVDWYPRLGFLDHILADETTPELFQTGCYGELGDFVVGAYTLAPLQDDNVTVIRQGHFWDGPEFTPLCIEKRYNIVDGMLAVTYRLANTGAEVRTFNFAVEVNAALSAGDLPDRFLQVHTTEGDRMQPLTLLQDLPATQGVSYHDNWLPCVWAVNWSQPARLWTIPLITPMCTLEGEEMIYQSTATLPIWKVTLAPGESWQVSITAVLKELGVRS